MSSVGCGADVRIRVNASPADNLTSDLFPLKNNTARDASTKGSRAMLIFNCLSAANYT